MTKTHDRKCADLALQFIDDDPRTASAEDKAELVKQLASEIQGAIEDWFGDLRYVRDFEDDQA